tara:strand:- start:95 stop:1414 length:1320 start_codon:yes stop_codon:yes gene_type:complete
MAVAAGDGSVSEATMTRMQELGSAWIFKRAIQDNKQFKKWEDIRNDKVTFNEIEKIWKKAGKVNWVDYVDLPWLINFYKQQEVLLPEVGNAKFTLFTRDGKSSEASQFRWQKHSPETFMEWVTKLVKTEFDIGNKDNWNPADIWLIKDEKKWKKKIKESFNQKKDPTASIESELAKFNAIFRSLFRTRQIMGISLKKIGKTAVFKPVNVTGKFFKNLKTTKMRLDNARCLLGTKRINPETARKDIARGKPRGAPGAATLVQDTVLTIVDPGLVSGKKTEYKVQIKANDSTRFSNLKWEPTIKTKGAARLGKATVELVLDLMKVYGIMISYEPDNKAFPKNKTQFREVEDDYRKIIDELLMDRFVDLGNGVDVETAIINIKETFDLYRGQPWVAVSKLQQLRFLYALMTLKEDKQNDFCTSLIFTAEKAGKRYGPYGKIY